MRLYLAHNGMDHSDGSVHTEGMEGDTSTTVEQDTQSNSEQNSNVGNQAESTVATTEQKVETKQIYQKTDFWIGLALLTASVVIGVLLIRGKLFGAKK